MSSCHLALYLLYWVSSLSAVSLLVHVLRIGWRSRLFVHCSLGASVTPVRKGWWIPPVKPLRPRWVICSFQGSRVSLCCGQKWTETALLHALSAFPLSYNLCPLWAQQVPLGSKEQVSTLCCLGPPPSVYETLAVDLISFTGMELGPPALGVQSLSHWTSREVPGKLAPESSLFSFLVLWSLRWIIFL